ncbi:MAG: hypothetical protein WD266_06645 [Balneolales bacterium]
MRKITESESQILARLVFDETFDSVREETGLQFGELRDDLTKLINDGLIEVTGINKHGITYFDSDRPQLFSYRATRTGLNAIKMNRL